MRRLFDAFDLSCPDIRQAWLGMAVAVHAYALLVGLGLAGLLPRQAFLTVNTLTLFALCLYLAQQMFAAVRRVISAPKLQGAPQNSDPSLRIDP